MKDHDLLHRSTSIISFISLLVTNHNYWYSSTIHDPVMVSLSTALGHNISPIHHARKKVKRSIKGLGT